jgi:hypothetical protein
MRNKTICIRHGFSRIVLLLGSLAIKLPRFWSWYGLIEGISCNLHEARLWKLTKHQNLCPVIFSLAGLVLIMKRAITPTIPNIINDRRIAISVENKPESWGLIDQHAVALDYGHDTYCFHCGKSLPYWNDQGWFQTNKLPI